MRVGDYPFTAQTRKEDGNEVSLRFGVSFQRKLVVLVAVEQASETSGTKLLLFTFGVLLTISTRRLTPH